MRALRSVVAFLLCFDGYHADQAIVTVIPYPDQHRLPLLRTTEHLICLEVLVIFLDSDESFAVWVGSNGEMSEEPNLRCWSDCEFDESDR